jgi:hypothetical protein
LFRDGVDLQEKVFSIIGERYHLPEEVKTPNFTTLTHIPKDNLNHEWNKKFDFLGFGEDLQEELKDWGGRLFSAITESQNYDDDTNLLYFRVLFLVQCEGYHEYLKVW